MRRQRWTSRPSSAKSIFIKNGKRRSGDGAWKAAGITPGGLFCVVATRLREPRGGTGPAGREQGSGGQHRRCPMRPVAREPERGSGPSLVKCLSRLAGTSVIDRRPIAQPIEPPYTDPYVRWCGRGGGAILPPIPIRRPAFRSRRKGRPGGRPRTRGSALLEVVDARLDFPRPRRQDHFRPGIRGNLDIIDEFPRK